MLVMLILHFVCFSQVGPQLALARRNSELEIIFKLS